MCPAKDKHDSQAHITSCTLKETVHIHPESFVTSSILVEQEPRGAGACDTWCNRTVAGQEWMNDYVHSIKNLKLEECLGLSWSESICKDPSEYGNEVREGVLRGGEVLWTFRQLESRNMILDCCPNERHSNQKRW